MIHNDKPEPYKDGDKWIPGKSFHEECLECPYCFLQIADAGYYTMVKLEHPIPDSCGYGIGDGGNQIPYRCPID